LKRATISLVTDFVIHARATCRLQSDGRWAASSGELPVFVVGATRDEALEKLQRGMKELVAWWTRQPKEEFEAWIAELRATGVTMEPLQPDGGEMVLPILAHA
jgi:hypothetical protein